MALSTGFIDVFVEFATYLADLAAQETLAAFRQDIAIDNKETDGGFDPVTTADRAAEKALRHTIEETYPDHEIEGEEFGIKETGSDFRWVLDPIDGTRAYIAGLPSWGTLIALKYQGTPLIGVIDQPYLRERYVGTMTTATLNGKPIKTRALKDIRSAVIATTDPNLFTKPDEHAAFERVRKTTRLIRYGLDCYAYARLAAGSFDIVLETGLKPYDQMALIPVIEGAGGKALDWQGQAAGGGDSLLAIGNPQHQDAVLSLIAGTPL